MITPFFGVPFFSSPIVPYDSGTIYSAPTYIAPDQTTPSDGDQQSTQTSVGAQTASPRVVILKDGRRIDAPGYALVGSTLWILDTQGATQIPLSDVDVDATHTENLKQGINVIFPPAS